MTFLSRIYKEGIMNYWNEFRQSRYFLTNEKLFRIILGFIFFFFFLYFGISRIWLVTSQLNDSTHVSEIGPELS